MKFKLKEHEKQFALVCGQKATDDLNTKGGVGVARTAGTQRGCILELEEVPLFDE